MNKGLHTDNMLDHIWRVFERVDLLLSTSAEKEGKTAHLNDPAYKERFRAALIDAALIVFILNVIGLQIYLSLRHF